MRRIFILFLLFAFYRANAQDEFAATAFYTSFKKINDDARAGFTENKGLKRTSEFEDIVDEFRVKLMLPLADSGKIVIPGNGTPYVVYYFEPDKFRLKVDQRGLSLRDAIVTALNTTLYTRTETSVINDQPFTELLYYADASEDKKVNALFRQCIYYQGGKFYLSLEIRGKRDEE